MAVTSLCATPTRAAASSIFCAPWRATRESRRIRDTNGRRVESGTAAVADWPYSLLISREVILLFM